MNMFHHIGNSYELG